MVNSKELKALQIRRASKFDIRGLVTLENECFDTYYRQHRFSKAHFAYYLQNPHAILLVAVLNTSIIGYVAGSLKIARFESSAHLDSIAASQLYRRRGVGNQLIRCFFEEAKQQACTSVILEVAAANKSGDLFFTNAGFEKIRILKGYYDESIDGILMRLDL
ncbi:MAG: GNAT family N-acetyltransferase [Planctomycetota bacterium]